MGQGYILKFGANWEKRQNNASIVCKQKCTVVFLTEWNTDHYLWDNIGRVYRKVDYRW